MSARTGPDDTGAEERRAARQPAYDAVFAYIRTLPRDGNDYTTAARNATIWRAVEAALDAMGSPADPSALTEEQRDDICDLIPRDMVVWDDDDELQHFAHANADWWLDALGHPRRERGGCKACGRGGTCPADAFRDALIGSTLRELDKLGLLRPPAASPHRPPAASPPADPTGDRT